MKSGHLSCIIPTKLRSNKCNTTNKRLSPPPPPSKLLERFREAVFRLIMLTTLSKGCAAAGTRTTESVDTVPQRSCYYYQYGDPHHSEAVADCIEFIKKSASTDDETRDSTASSTSSSIDVTSEMAMAVPVM